MLLYGLLGYPLEHSFSARYFTDKFTSEHIEAQYLNFEFDSVSEALSVLTQMNGLQGFNVTIPFKQQIIPFLDGISVEAREIGAVNVVKVVRDNKGNPRLYGFNSDVYGFLHSFQKFYRPDVHSNALILGTGGASKAVYYALSSMGIESQFVSRTNGQNHLTYDKLNATILSRYKILVNCTPLGMYPMIKGLPDIPYETLTPSHYLYDLVYNPELTAFLQQGLKYGATVKNGLDMLHLQAEKAWEIWNCQ